MTRVVGLDLSIRRSGIALPDGIVLTITAPRSVEGYDRHWWVAAQVLEHVQRAEADVVVIEGYALGVGKRMPHTLAALAEVGGLVRVMLHRHGYPLAIIPPASLKFFATRSGRADKKAMLEAAQLLTAGAPGGHQPTTHDEADAYWLRRAGVAHYVLGVTPDPLTKVEWPNPKGTPA